jgi:hypothetical protein
MVVTCELPHSGWSAAHQELLARWLDWWAAFPELPQRQALLMLLYMPYEVSALAGLWQWSRIARIVRQLQQLRARVAVPFGILPPLASVRLEDAMAWVRRYLSDADREQVRRHLKGHFRGPFGLQRRLPMEPVAGLLNRLMLEQEGANRSA